MKRPLEHHYASNVAYTRALEAYCDSLANVPTSDTSQERVDETEKQRHEQEPVIDKSAAIRIATSLGWTPQRTWVGLTDEEAKEISLANRPYVIDMVRALEQRLKEKNT